MWNAQCVNKKNLLAVVLSLVVLVGLSGCLRMHQDLVLHSDNTVSGTMIMAYDLESALAEGLTREDLMSGMDTESLVESQGGTVTAAEYDQDGYLGYKLTLNNTPLETLGADTGVVITRDGEEFTFAVDLAELTTGIEFDQATLDILDVRFSVTFPGSVLAQEGGVVSGNTVSWTAEFTGDEVFSARGSAVADSGGLSGLAISLLVGGVVVLLLVVGLVVARGRAAGGVGPGGAGADVLVEGPADEGYSG